MNVTSVPQRISARLTSTPAQSVMLIHSSARERWVLSAAGGLADGSAIAEDSVVEHLQRDGDEHDDE